MKSLDNWYLAIGNREAGELTPAVQNSLMDDLNTPKAIAALHELRNLAVRGDEAAAGSLKAGAGMLGLLGSTAQEWQALGRESSDIDAVEVEAMIADRKAARAARDFAEADRLRDQLGEMGVVLKDGPEGTTWEVKR